MRGFTVSHLHAKNQNLNRFRQNTRAVSGPNLAGQLRTFYKTKPINIPLLSRKSYEQISWKRSKGQFRVQLGLVRLKFMQKIFLTKTSMRLFGVFQVHNFCASNQRSKGSQKMIYGSSQGHVCPNLPWFQINKNLLQTPVSFSLIMAVFLTNKTTDQISRNSQKSHIRVKLGPICPDFQQLRIFWQKTFKTFGKLWFPIFR